MLTWDNYDDEHAQPEVASPVLPEIALFHTPASSHAGEPTPRHLAGRSEESPRNAVFFRRLRGPDAPCPWCSLCLPRVALVPDWHSLLPSPGRPRRCARRAPSR